jgi:hypothetical protein
VLRYFYEDVVYHPEAMVAEVQAQTAPTPSQHMVPSEGTFPSTK